jgi:hypothetical protein
VSSPGAAPCDPGHCPIAIGGSLAQRGACLALTRSWLLAEVRVSKLFGVLGCSLMHENPIAWRHAVARTRGLVASSLSPRAAR